MDVSQFSIEGKVALVTGASRGIGEATALCFAKAGADVILASRKQEELDRVAAEVQKFGVRALPVATHAGRMDQIENLVARSVSEFGKIDILVNNAGTTVAQPALEFTEKAWDSVMNLNLKGVFFLSQAVAKVMVESGGGRIINVTSVSGYRPEVPTCAYSISKAGTNMATMAMANEWAQYNILVNGIAPGPIDTHLLNARWSPLPDDQAQAAKSAQASRVPLKRIGDPQEIADVALFLASSASSYVTGQTFIVDGGALLV